MSDTERRTLLRRAEDARVSQLADDVTNLKTEMAEIKVVVHQVRDILATFRITMSIAKWIGAISAAAAGLIAAWKAGRA